ncbi:MAG: EFR1 family ferrodoxin [Deltaproteobacteria bacterium]|jgi:NAD-dependent dihydropyrimidine dehydrogenase PreA subunit/flavodoxin|nr:EFR1 family ferrodoxin [Deltaproteobacteria bacterium]
MAYQVIRNTLIYFSPTGATRQIAKSIAQGIAINPREFDLTLPADRSKRITLEEAEFLLLAFPVYGGRLPSMIPDLIGQLPKGKRPVAAVVVFGNVGYGDALLELYDLCVSRDFEIKAAAAFVGEHSYSKVLGENRPNDADKELARVFGVKIRQSLFSNQIIIRERISRKGKGFYLPRPEKLKLEFMLRPRSCEVCRICVHSCPVGAFKGGDPKKIDYKRCIACAACLKLCPHNARKFGDDQFLDDVAIMAANNNESKAPVTFLPPNLPENFFVR